MVDTFIVENLLPIDRPNRNNRIYSHSCAEKIVSDFNEKKKEGGSVFGELDSPVSIVDALAINLDRISHSVEDVFIEDAFLKARIKISNTPMGNILNTLHSHGVNLGFAMRGYGEVHESGHINNYNLITVDVTGQPSTITKSNLANQIEQIMYSMEKDGLL